MTFGKQNYISEQFRTWTNKAFWHSFEWKKVFINASLFKYKCFHVQVDFKYHGLSHCDLWILKPSRCAGNNDTNKYPSTRRHYNIVPFSFSKHLKSWHFNNKYSDRFASSSVRFLATVVVLMFHCRWKRQLVINWRRLVNNKRQTPGPGKFGPIIINQSRSEPLEWMEDTPYSVGNVWHFIYVLI